MNGCCWICLIQCACRSVRRWSHVGLLCDVRKYCCHIQGFRSYAWMQLAYILELLEGSGVCSFRLLPFFDVRCKVIHSFIHSFIPLQAAAVLQIAGRLRYQ
jgi:hypothetical protein